MIFGAERPRRPRSPPRASRRASSSSFSAGDLPPKLIPSLRAMVSTGASLLHTRLALAGIELEEEMQRFISAAALGVVALIFVLLALIVGTFTIVVAVPPEYRVGTMIGITLLYLVIAIVAVVRVRSIFANRPPIFSATLTEIEKDKETLSQMNRAYETAEEARERASHSDEDAFASVRAADHSTTQGAM
jgi:uncharacterized membrane protein YqjE